MFDAKASDSTGRHWRASLESDLAIFCRLCAARRTAACRLKQSVTGRDMICQ
jgi:hypothetical protein